MLCHFCPSGKFVARLLSAFFLFCTILASKIVPNVWGWLFLQSGFGVAAVRATWTRRYHDNMFRVRSRYLSFVTTSILILLSFVFYVGCAA